MAAALAACSSAHPDGGNEVANASVPGEAASLPAPAGPGAEGKPPRIAEWKRSGASLLSRRSGRLAIAGGCLVLTGEGGSATLPIFPAGAATWSGGALSYKAKSYALGDGIDLSGGAVSAEEAARRAIAVPAGCPVDALFLVN
ncbi:MAG: hypothetical protein ABWX67_12885 [Allosphingosinicella sp.]